MNLKNWKVYFVGTIEESFQKEVDEFFIKNKNLSSNVLFLGSISNSDELNEIYQKSKVFCLTSLWESYGLVLLEASFFNNYLVASDVGAASDLVRKYKCSGTILDLNTEDYRKTIQNIIDNDIKNVENNLEYLQIDNVIEPIVNDFKGI